MGSVMVEARIEKSGSGKKAYAPPRVRSERLDAPVLFAGSPRCPPNAPPNAPQCQ